MDTIELVQTRVGLPKVIGSLPHGAGDRWSSIDRQPLSALTVYVTWTGIAGDQCTETMPKPDGTGFIHGGVDKAIYVYPEEHYEWWQSQLGEGLNGRCFGENWIIRGALEADVHIGDVWMIGDAEFEVCKVRTPCDTLTAHFGGQGVGRRMTDSGRCGWYLKVRRPGVVPTRGTITVVRRSLNGPTVADVFADKMRTRAGA